MGPFRRVFLSVISAALHDPGLAESTDNRKRGPAGPTGSYMQISSCPEARRPSAHVVQGSAIKGKQKTSFST